MYLLLSTICKIFDLQIVEYERLYQDYMYISIQNIYTLRISWIHQNTELPSRSVDPFCKKQTSLNSTGGNVV